VGGAFEEMKMKHIPCQGALGLVQGRRDKGKKCGWKEALDGFRGGSSICGGNRGKKKARGCPGTAALKGGRLNGRKNGQTGQPRLRRPYPLGTKETNQLLVGA